jgi:hypothetical protein
MHQWMWGLVHDDPEIFALLASANNLPASERFLELGAASADFAVNIGIVDGDDLGEGLADEVFADIVDYARDFGDFGHVECL